MQLSRSPRVVSRGFVQGSGPRWFRSEPAPRVRISLIERRRVCGQILECPDAVVKVSSRGLKRVRPGQRTALVWHVGELSEPRVGPVHCQAEGLHNRMEFPRVSIQLITNTK